MKFIIKPDNKKKTDNDFAHKEFDRFPHNVSELSERRVRSRERIMSTTRDKKKKIKKKYHLRWNDTEPERRDHGLVTKT